MLKKALQSIASQTYGPIEVVLVNDGGCDLEIEELNVILGDISLDYRRLQKNMGRAHAGNVGIENSKGEYVGFLDDDDEFYPEHVEALVSCLNAVDYKVAYSDSELVFKEFDSETGDFRETGKEQFASRDFSLEELLIENYIPLINILFSREALAESGKLDIDFELYEDWDLLIRCASRFPFYHVKKVTSKYVQWSKDLQVAQSEKFRSKAALACDNIYEKHRDKFTVDMIKYLIHFRNLNRDLRDIVTEKELLTSKLESALKQLESAALEKDSAFLKIGEQITSLRQVLHEKDEHIVNLQAVLNERDLQITHIESELREKEVQINTVSITLDNIYKSRGWKALSVYYKSRDRIFPAASRRRKVAKSFAKLLLNPSSVLSKDNIRKSLFYLRHYGIGAFIKKAGAKLTSDTGRLFHRPEVPNLNLSRIKETELTPYEDASISVIIPTKNAGADFEHLLSMLKRQRGLKSLEIVLVDSGSTDETMAIAGRKGARIIEIPSGSFSHSYARNVGADAASGNYILFTVQDALPPSDVWLYELFCALKNSDAVAVSCRESPREDVDLLYRVLTWNHQRFLEIESGDRILSKPEKNDYVSIRKNSQLSDVACLIKREIFAKYRYRHDYAEDLDLGLRLIRDGYKLALLGSVEIIHSHNRPCSYYLKRWYAENLVLPKIIPAFPMPSISYDSLVCDIAFTYHAVNDIAAKELSGRSLQCKTQEIVKTVPSAFNSPDRFKFPQTLDAGGNKYIDAAFETFLRKIFSQYNTSSCGYTYRGLMLNAMADFMKKVVQYLNASNDLCGESELEEMRACMYKAFALQCGAHLSYCYHSTDSGTRDLLLGDIHSELVRDI